MSHVTTALVELHTQPYVIHRHWQTNSDYCALNECSRYAITTTSKNRSIMIVSTLNFTFTTFRNNSAGLFIVNGLVNVNGYIYM